MNAKDARTPKGHVEAVREVPPVESVPTQLVAALEDIALSTTRASLFNAVGRALFCCTKARSATLSLWNADRGEGDFFVEANFHDGVPWGFHLGDAVAPHALTRTMNLQRLPLIRTQETGEALDADWFTYPCFLGVPVGVDEKGPLPGTIVLGFMHREAVDCATVGYVQIVAQMFAGVLARLGRYTSAVQAGQTLEREYILQQLHDSAVQDIFACEMAIASALDDSRLAADTRVKLENALDEARQANRNLRLILSGALGDEASASHLKALIDLEIASHVAQGGTTVTTVVDGDLELARPLRAACKAFLHETFCNVRKHAQASNVLVMASVVDNTLLLSVEDDGKGVNVPETPGVVSETSVDLPHFGLRNLRRGIEVCGGVLEIESEPGEGTLIRARLPLDLGEPCR